MLDWWRLESEEEEVVDEVAGLHEQMLTERALDPLHRGHWHGNPGCPLHTPQSAVGHQEVGHDTLRRLRLHHGSPCGQTDFHCSCPVRRRKICSSSKTRNIDIHC